MIVKCSHCHKMFSEASFDTHECDLPLTHTKTIEVAYFRDDSTNKNQRVTGRGIDGILYTFEVVPRKAIPIAIPLNRRKVTPFGTDEDETEL
jgi:hypothetical protein